MPGRPSVVESQPGILEALKEVVQVNLAGADERRRSETIRTVRTLDDLQKQVVELGFEISRTGLYYQLLPRNARTTEGKRHHSLVKVKSEHIYISLFLCL